MRATLEGQLPSKALVNTTTNMARVFLRTRRYGKGHGGKDTRCKQV